MILGYHSWGLDCTGWRLFLRLDRLCRGTLPAGPLRVEGGCLSLDQVQLHPVGGGLTLHHPHHLDDPGVIPVGPDQVGQGTLPAGHPGMPQVLQPPLPDRGVGAPADQGGQADVGPPGGGMGEAVDDLAPVGPRAAAFRFGFHLEHYTTAARQLHGLLLLLTSAVKEACQDLEDQDGQAHPGQQVEEGDDDEVDDH